MRLKLTKQWWQMGWLVVLSLYSSGMTYAADVPPDYFTHIKTTPLQLRRSDRI
ncbi:MAG: hypothetical protein HWD63_15340 [Candidatus Parvibacillus calidus]|nr:MAG: hypothetical protein HWD63_15340 [Candidatus Parvibacillus calidus]